MNPHYNPDAVDATPRKVRMAVDVKAEILGEAANGIVTLGIETTTLAPLDEAMLSRLFPHTRDMVQKLLAAEAVLAAFKVAL